MRALWRSRWLEVGQPEVHSPRKIFGKEERPNEREIQICFGSNAGSLCNRLVRLRERWNTAREEAPSPQNGSAQGADGRRADPEPASGSGGPDQRPEVGSCGERCATEAGATSGGGRTSGRGKGASGR